mgnify:CR=1 FL=1
MLYIHIKKPENAIQEIDYYFDNHKTKDWFNRQDVKDVILRLDNTVAVKDEYLESPIFGGMSPERLSTTCKAVILMLVTDRPIYATKCGDNAAELIVEISKKKDLHIWLHHPMRLPDKFDAIIVDSDLEVHTGLDYALEYGRLRYDLGEGWGD